MEKKALIPRYWIAKWGEGQRKIYGIKNYHYPYDTAINTGTVVVSWTGDDYKEALEALKEQNAQDKLQNKKAEPINLFTSK